ncbi:MAG: hypothetical protein A2001_01505 [Treponema sp. GWC1_61_84]|nr:MAG: hypothetical protein A2001_01505 [Treponema sp. GWC1_61_84]
MGGGRKPRSEVLVYCGTRYTWSPKGYWRSTTMADRHSLTRRIWTERSGPIPPGHKVIFLDGNRFNVHPDNLACLSHSDCQKRRLLDPEYKMIVKCYVLYGHLIRAIEDKIDPERILRRCEKAWLTRRLRFGPSGGNRGRSVVEK